MRASSEQADNGAGPSEAFEGGAAVGRYEAIDLMPCDMARPPVFDLRRRCSTVLTLRFFRFVVVGATNFALTYLVYVLLLRAALRPGLALLAANILGILYTSALNTKLVFSVEVRWATLAPQFVYYVIYGFAYASVVEVVVAQHLLAPEFAPLPVLALAMPMNFCITRFLVARRSAVEY